MNFYNAAAAYGLVVISIVTHHTNGFALNSIAIRPAPITLRLSDCEHMLDFKERPLLKRFGEGIRKRIIDSGKGHHRMGKVGAYTSKETIPRLNMQCRSSTNIDLSISSRCEIREAFSESETSSNPELHGRSSGSGCVIIRLQGDDAVSMHKLAGYADRFFDQIDSSENNGVSDVGVLRIDNHVYAGFDEDVNGEGKMQFLDTRMYSNGGEEDDSTLLPLELDGLMGSTSMNDAHAGMNILLDIGTQITSAVLGMDSESADKLIDDGKPNIGIETDSHVQAHNDQVSNSYHRLIRYLKPQPDANNAAFAAHVDSSFLTLIPLPELPGKISDCVNNLIAMSNLTYLFDCFRSRDMVSITINRK